MRTCGCGPRWDFPPSYTSSHPYFLTSRVQPWPDLKAAPFPARGSSTPRSWRGSASSTCSRGRSSTASSTGCTARPTSAPRSTSRNTAATCRATTSAASTGGCTRGRTSTSSNSTKPTPTPTSRCCWTSQSRWASPAAASRSWNTRASWPPVWPTWRTGSGTASASSRSTTTSSTTCRCRPSTSTSCCTRSIDRSRSGPAT